MASRQRPRTIRGCEICRAAHAKCDIQLPSCGRCILLKRECIRGLPFPFRHSNQTTERSGDKEQESRVEFEFAEDQIWVAGPASVEFVYEDPSDISSSREPNDFDISAQSDGGAACPDPEPEPPTPTRDHQFTNLEKPQKISGSDNQSIQRAPSDSHPLIASFGTGFNQNTPRPPTPDAGLTPGISIWQSPHTPRSTQGLRRHVSLESPLGSSLSRRVPSLILHTPDSTSEPQHWPLADKTEAILLRYFVTDLSQWFDYCDPQKSFATSVIQCAVTSRPLLYAILATSARHLSVTTGFDTDKADRYHRECLASLIPILDDSSAALDEALYAATVILRLYEEISVPLVGQDTQSHLMGTHTFVRAQEYHEPSGIRLAAFRVVLRQEIVVAFRSQKPVLLLREYILVDRSMTRADDWTWTFHILVLCAEVLSFCYGEDPITAEGWGQLSSRAQSWKDSTSASFEPLHCSTTGISESQVFPEIWLLNDCHVAAHQHYLICQILLEAHDPRKPRLGPGRNDAIENTNSIIRDHVRTMCGIALSNSHCIPAMFTTSMVIAICGDLFIEYQEQKAMLDILIKTDLSLAWPTASVQTYLRQKWGWDQT